MTPEKRLDPPVDLMSNYGEETTSNSHASAVHSTRAGKVRCREQARQPHENAEWFGGRMQNWQPSSAFLRMGIQVVRGPADAKGGGWCLLQLCPCLPLASHH